MSQWSIFNNVPFFTNGKKKWNLLAFSRIIDKGQAIFSQDLSKSKFNNIYHTVQISDTTIEQRESVYELTKDDMYFWNDLEIDLESLGFVYFLEDTELNIFYRLLENYRGRDWQGVLHNQYLCHKEYRNELKLQSATNEFLNSIYDTIFKFTYVYPNYTLIFGAENINKGQDNFIILKYTKFEFTEQGVSGQEYKANFDFECYVVSNEKNCFDVASKFYGDLRNKFSEMQSKTLINFKGNYGAIPVDYQTDLGLRFLNTYHFSFGINIEVESLLPKPAEIKTIDFEQKK